jgi:hypothetical protein
MANKQVGRSFDEINSKIKAMAREVNSAKAEVRALDGYLKLDPRDIEKTAQKMRVLQQSADNAAVRLADLRKERDKLSSGPIDSAAQKMVERLDQQILKAESNVKSFNNQLFAMRSAAATAHIDALNAKLDKFKGIAQTASRVALGLVGALAAITAKVVQVGDELDDVAKKYQTTAEELQLQRNLYAKLTESSEGYETALKSIGGLMSSIARGRGKAYLETMEKLGIAQADIANVTNADVYNLIVAKLRMISDEAERASIAQALLGDAGLNVALIAGTEISEIDRLNAAMAEAGLISNEQAAKAGEIADKWDNVKYQFMSSAAVLMEALMPAIDVLVKFLQEQVIPALSALFGWFGNLSSGGQALIGIILLFVIVLPKLIGVVEMLLGVMKLIRIATIGQTAANAGLSVASAPLVPLFIAIAAAILLVVGLLALFSARARETVKSVTALRSSMGDLGASAANLDANIGTTATQYTEATSTKRVEMDVNVKAEGDTPLSAENADQIANRLRDQLNEQLGGMLP